MSRTHTRASLWLVALVAVLLLVRLAIALVDAFEGVGGRHR
ncbi:MAG: hypothetical protein WCD76_16915 [Pyrinomonadaceae bacterium]